MKIIAAENLLIEIMFCRMPLGITLVDQLFISINSYSNISEANPK